jgi:hypothetical protein
MTADWRALARPATYPARRVELQELDADASDYERPARIIAPSVPAEIYRRMRGLQCLVECGPLADWTIQATLPSTANLREHHHTRAARAKKARAAAFASVPTILRDVFKLQRPPSSLVVLMVRQAPRLLDGDNAESACKNHRDGIADALGINDRDERCQWFVVQEKCNVPSLRVIVVRGRS